MSEFRVNVSASQVVNVPFGAKQILINNILPRWVYIRLGGSDVPTQKNCDLAVPPMSTHLVPIPASRIFGIGLGSDIITLGRQVPTGQNAIVTFYDAPLPSGLGSINLNPSTIGTSQVYPITTHTTLSPSFPATQMYVSNYLRTWIYYATDIDAIVASASEQVLNPGFETLGANPPTFANWSQAGAGSPSIDSGHTGVYSCKLIGAGGAEPYIYQGLVSIPGTVHRFSSWYKSSAGGLMGRLYDATHGASISDFTVTPSATWSYQYVDVTIPAGCTSILIIFYSLGLGSTVWVDDVSLKQITPTDSNNQGGIAPLSEKSISLAPCSRIEIGLGTQTIVTTTSVPTSRSAITLYEYPIPITLGTAPLSPGGFRSRQVLRSGVSITDGTTIDVDLSNFNFFRYTISASPASTVRWGVNIFAFLGGASFPYADVPPFRGLGNATVNGEAGTVLRIWFVTDTNPVTVTDQIEAW